MNRKPVIEAKKKKGLLMSVQHVFRANFNDTYLLEQKEILFDTLDREKLTWFDPYLGKSKKGDTLVAIAYASDERFVILERQGDRITEKEHDRLSEHIICEDFDRSVLLAAHLRFIY